MECNRPATIKTYFAPMLLHQNGVMAIAFYKEAFGAVEIKRWNNDDGTVHVAEMSIDGAVFHLREESPEDGRFCPSTMGGTTCMTELYVDDPRAVVERAVAAGAHVLEAVRDYEETGYREGSIVDPFGHRWILLRKIQN